MNAIDVLLTALGTKYSTHKPASSCPKIFKKFRETFSNSHEARLFVREPVLHIPTWDG